MIVFLVTRKHSYTLHRWFDYNEEKLRGKVRILCYEDVCNRFPLATYIFTDVERLNAAKTRLAVRIWDKLNAAGMKVLNHPARSLRRYDLQKAIDNDFEVYRADEDLSAVRPPVFLRKENDHSGSLTPILHTQEELDQALLEYPKALIVEFIDTSDRNGIYRKYSYYRFGDDVFPVYLDFCTDWMVKSSVSDVEGPEYLNEYRSFVSQNPHEKEVREIFDKGRIEYGRIDYSFYEGRLQTFEINSNPLLSGQAYPEKQELPEFREVVVDSILCVDEPSLPEEAAWIPRMPPHCWPRKTQFLR